MTTEKKQEFIYEPTKYLYPQEPSKFGIVHIENFLAFCTRSGASDITLKTGDYAWVEIHGKFYKVTKKTLSHTELLDFVKGIFGDAAISELNSGKQQDKAYEIKPDRDTRMRFRVNAVGILVDGNRGVEMTLRTIVSLPPHISKMEVPDSIIENIAPKQGMVLVTGATGSGKSTLLASIIRMLCEQEFGHRKIITFEAPVEYVYDEVKKPTTTIAQTEIPNHLEDFTEALRNALRRKPSIILVGEMRDKETISEGVTASMTGHLLYSTVHSNGFADTMRRMINTFPEGEKNAKAVDIITSCKMVISQMLVPSTDGKRVALREYVVMNDRIADLMLDAPLDKLSFTSRKILKEFGQSFLQDATAKYDEGRIDVIEFNKILKLTKAMDKDSES